MKKAISAFVLILILFNVELTVNAHSIEPDFYRIFDDLGTIMLLIDSETGSIEWANKAAAEFYGYSLEKLESMKFYELNALSLEEVKGRIEAASSEGKNCYTLEQYLANGEIRTVEVYSCPYVHEDKHLLITTVYDITDKVYLKKKDNNLVIVVFFELLVIIAFLLIFTALKSKSSKKIKEKNREIKSIFELYNVFMNSIDRPIYLKDGNLNYLVVNKALSEFYNIDKADIIGKKDFELPDAEIAELNRETDLSVLQEGKTTVKEINWKDGIYRVAKFPVKLLNGSYGIGAYIVNMNEWYNHKRIEEKNLARSQIIVDVLTKNFKSTREQMDYVLNESVELTESKFGFIYFYNEENQEFILYSWSKNLTHEYSISKKQTKQQLERASLWNEVINQKKSVIVNSCDNNCEMPNLIAKDHGKGNIKITRFMAVPVIVDDKLAAIVGLANKGYDYDNNDVYQIIALMNGAWNAKERREALLKLSVERNKSLQTLISIGDGVMVVDQERKVTMLNKVAEKLTGWTAKEAEGKNYKEVFVLSHEEEGQTIDDPIEKVFETNKIQEFGNHAILTSKDGRKLYIEDSAAPIKNNMNVTSGVVLVFRDVTEKKEQRKKIEYLSFHDSLTGLYNRMFYEQELKRLDTENNLPISIIKGDVNGLKLTNDIFGHAAGDLLLQKVAEVFRKVCRESDIIARIGGDEFIILLPKTKAEEAEKIILKIKEEFAKENIKAIKGSISLGTDTKNHADEDIYQVLENAENKMYFAKVINRNDMKKSTIETIIKTLHEDCPTEKEHSSHVAEICGHIGKALGLSEAEIKRLKEAGFLHDIGKIVIDEKLLKKKGVLTEQEKKELIQHSIAGFRILNSFDHTLDLAESILAHHESWDGTGYPKGLKGEEIPKLARIIAIAESYDRMVNSLNEETVTKEEAIKIIKQRAGVKFDPHIVDVFVKMMLEGDC